MPAPQILLFFNAYYSTLFFITTLFLYFYKSYHYHYPYAAFEWELTMLALMAFMETARITLASRGNKTEQTPPLLWSILLSFPMIVGFVFYLTIQTYVLRLDIVMNTVALAFVSTETVISVFTVMSFFRGFTG